MLTLRLNVKHSTFAQLMELEVWLSTASYVLMVHCSTRTTSSVTGGSTLTAPLPRISTLSMMKLLLSEKLFLLTVLVPMKLLLTTLLAELAGGWEGAGGVAGGVEREISLTAILSCHFDCDILLVIRLVS